jgi:hypothetical protein
MTGTTFVFSKINNGLLKVAKWAKNPNLVTLGIQLIRGQRWVRWSSKWDICSTTKCDQNHISRIHNMVTPEARAKHERLLNKLATVCLTKDYA